MSSIFQFLQPLVRCGLPLAIFGLGSVWCCESEAQIFRGRATRQPSALNNQLNNNGWRPAHASTRSGETSLRESALRESATPDAPNNSGLGNLIRSDAPDQLPVENELQPARPVAGTPVPEHYYRGDWRRDPAYNPGYPNYPRYFGGFHSSHYYDLGIPNGDKGFRGNGIYWTPW